MKVQSINQVGIVRRNSQNIKRKENPNGKPSTSTNANANANDISFKSNVPSWFADYARNLNVNDVVRKLRAKGIRTEFQNNKTVAACTDQTVRLFEEHGFALPDAVIFTNIGRNYGTYTPSEKAVRINSAMSCHYDLDMQARDAMSSKARIFNGEIFDKYSSTHFLNSYIHEFMHNAHFKNLIANGNRQTWDFLRSKTVPTAIGRLVSRFKLGNYSTASMLEFMAERGTKDVGSRGLVNDVVSKPWEALSEYQMLKRYRPNSPVFELDYSNIFSDQWNNRFSTPQAYLDYYTQQVWNGDIVGIEKAGDIAEIFLREIDSQSSVVRNGSLVNLWDRICSSTSNLIGEAMNRRHSIRHKF